MLDIYLNDPSLISNEIQKLIRHESSINEDNEEFENEEQVQPMYKGSLFDYLM